MTSKLYYHLSDTLDPYANIAREEQLLLGVPSDSVILYLWQNERTVVIGRNQSAWRECRVEELKRDGGSLARRLSGGGAVYHDTGNLNFTFLYPRGGEDIARQTAVIAGAVASYGLKPEISGRNDITVDGRKFSGNAYYAQGERAYHHGTIMLSVDAQQLTRYLNVHEDKYRSKGVDSVRARVVNLCALDSGITVEGMKTRLLRAFETAYQGKAQPVPGAWMREEELQVRRERFQSWEWIYGRPIACTWQDERRFPWGLLRAEISVDKGCVQDARVFTDALRVDVFHALEDRLPGLPFERDALLQAAQAAVSEEPYRQDCQSLLSRAF